MKVKIVFDLEERDRRAVAIDFKKKRPVTRIEVTQWIMGMVTRRQTELHQELCRREANPDPNQMKFAAMDDSGSV